MDIIKAYPEIQKNEVADVFANTGLASTFRKSGFEEVARRSPTSTIMRFIKADRNNYLLNFYRFVQ